MIRQKTIRLALVSALFFASAIAPLSIVAADAGTGQAVAEGLKFRSKILGKDVAYAVYAPPDYATSTRRYPVVYLLHGLSDDDSGWIQYGEVHLAADHLGRELADVGAVVHHDALVALQRPGELSVADVDRHHLGRAVAQQHVGEPTRRRAGVQAPSTRPQKTSRLQPVLVSSCSAKDDRCLGVNRVCRMS